MKKKLCLIMICLLAVGMLAGCGSSDDPYADYDLEEYIKVGKYKGLAVEPYTIKVTDKEVDERIDSEVEAAAKTVELDKNDKVKKEDTVNIDYVGKIDGKEFENGSAEGSDLVIGSNSFIDGFESGLIGKKVGDKVKLELKFPDDYHSDDVKGKDVVFDVTINSATRKNVPEYNLDFVKENTKYKSLKAYEASIEKTIYDEKEAQAVENQKSTLWAEVVEDSEVKKYPEEILKEYMDITDEQIDKAAETYGMTRAELLENYYNAKSEEEFKTINQDTSQSLMKQEMILDYIGDKEELKYTDEEKEELLKSLEDQGYDEDAIEEQTGRTAGEYAHINLMYEKVVDFILDNAKESKK